MKFEYDLILYGEIHLNTASTKKRAIDLKREYCIALNTTKIEIKKVKERTLDEKMKIIRAKMTSWD